MERSDFKGGVIVGGGERSEMEGSTGTEPVIGNAGAWR